MNVEIMSAEELVQWAKPVTVLEKCLHAKLREALEDIEDHQCETEDQE